MAVAIFTPKSNSQDFNERRIALTESVKIGRSVAKVKSATTNCIFDCKVLSRNHAIVWYEGGKFYLQDTKSSNGTFVNNVRLSKGAEESEPKEIHSGDILQFGVEVVENSKRGAVTHGCIIATLTLFGPDGKEVTKNTNSSRGSLLSLGGSGIQSYELWQLSQYIQDALHREQALENKIVTLQRIIGDAQSTTDETFENILQEDKLLTRLETLENHLDNLTKNCSEDEIKQEMIRLHEDKNKYEMAAKESLRKITEEKLLAVERISILEKSCSNAEDECSHYHSLYERAQKELEDLAEKHKQRLDEMQTLHEQIENSERTHISLEEQINKERESTSEKSDILLNKELQYVSRLESLQAECDFRKEQLVAMRAQMEKKSSVGSTNYVSQNNQHNLNQEEINAYSLVEETIQVLKEKLQRLKDESKVKEETVNDIKAKLEHYEPNGTDEETMGLQALQQELLDSEKNLKQTRGKIGVLEEQLMACHLKAVDNLDDEDDTNSLIVNKSSPESTTDFPNHMGYPETDETDFHVDMLYDLEAELQNIENELRSSRRSTDHEEFPLSPSNENGDHKSELIMLKCMRHIQFIKNEMDEYQEQFSTRDSSLVVTSDEGSCDDNPGAKTVSKLRDQLRNAESKASEVKHEILTLRDKLLEEQETLRAREELIAQLRTQISELTRSKSLSDLEKTTEHKVAESAKSTAKHMQKQAAMSAEKASKNRVQLRTLQEENKFLNQRVQTMESELKWSKRETQRLTIDKEKRDTNKHNHKNMKSPTDADQIKIQEEQERLHNSLERKPKPKDSSKRIDALHKRNTKLKYCLIPVFCVLLAILVTFSFGILGTDVAADSKSL